MSAKSTILGFIGTIGGFGAGYLIATKIAKAKYLKKLDEEVNSVKDALKQYYESKSRTPKDEEKKDDFWDKEFPEEKIGKPTKQKIDLIDRDSIDYDKLKNAEEKDYIKYTKQYNTESQTTPEKNDKEEPQEERILEPVVISPEEFNESEYDCRTLTYYSDGVLADDDYNIIKDIKGTVGSEALNSFGVYEEDVVYVRNRKYEIDYEILFDERAFSDAAPKGTIRSFPGEDEE